MISTRIAPRKDGKSSASNGLKYGEGLTRDRETGEYLDKSYRTRLCNFGLVDDGIYAGRGVDGMAGIISLAAIEMQSNCDLNTRVADIKKIVHFVISYGQNKPTEAALRDSEDSMVSELGLENNHRVSFLHNDNGFWHLHIFSSTIEKDNPKHRCNPLWHDKLKRDKVCREVEIRHGLNRDNGAHEVDKDGKIVEIPIDERRKRREAKPLGISRPAKKTESYSGEKSFQTWIHEIRIGDRLKHAKNWQDMHTAAAAYGCKIRQKGAGFVICPTGEKGGSQLSRVGLKNLQAKFGAFEAAMRGQQAQPEISYSPSPTNPKAAGHYQKWREARDAFKPLKTDQINQLRESHNSIRSQLRAQHKAELKNIRANSEEPDRFATVSIAKMQQVIAMDALVDQFGLERQRLRKMLAEQGPGNSFRDYLVVQAGKGDNEALTLAQKYGADQTTDVARKREADKLKIKATITGYEYRAAARLVFAYQVLQNGTIIFDLGNGRIIVDSAISKQVLLNAHAANDPDSIATALQYAAAKFGNILVLTGSPEFRRLAVETAVRDRLNINFKDPELQAYKLKFVAENHNICIDPAPTKLPTWNDPDSPDSYFKTTVARYLKRALPKIKNWQALHVFFERYNITLDETGGGGLRLYASSPETGEILDLPASKGLRLLKRSELEARWGKFTIVVPFDYVVPDKSHLTHKQLTKGAQDVINRYDKKGIPPDHIIRANGDAWNRTRKSAARQSGRLHELPGGDVDVRHDADVLLPGASLQRVGNQQRGGDIDLRCAGSGVTSSGGEKKNSLREEMHRRREESRRRSEERRKQNSKIGVQKTHSGGETARGGGITVETVKPEIEQKIPDIQLPVKRLSTDMKAIEIEKTETPEFKREELSVEQKLRNAILEIDPDAAFEIPVFTDEKKTYTGPVIAVLNSVDDLMFAQHVGRSNYVLHPIEAPANAKNKNIDVKYNDGKPVITLQNQEKNGKE